MRTINKGILYTKKKIPRFQTGGSFDSSSFQYDDSSLFGSHGKDAFGSPINRTAGLGFGTSPSISKGFNANSFNNWQNKIRPSIGKAAPVKPSGYDFANATKLTSPLRPELAYNYVDPNDPKKVVEPSGPTSAESITSAAAPMVGALGTSLMQKGDDDATTFTGKEKANLIGGSVLKTAATGASLAGTAATLAGTALTTSAATALGVGGSAAVTGALAGSVVPIIGTAIGAAIGIAVGIFSSKKAKKKAAIAKKQQDVRYASAASAKRRTEISERDAILAASIPSTGQVIDGNIQGYASRKNGGSFHYTLKPSVSENRITLMVPTVTKKFKRGGRITATENIIPNGVLHEEFNKLGDKGMPVVKCKNNSCEKKYEIERDEMIFTLSTTKTVEELVKEGDLKKLGAFVKKQVLDNTHSFTDKFNELNTYNKKKNESIFS